MRCLFLPQTGTSAVRHAWTSSAGRRKPAKSGSSIENGAKGAIQKTRGAARAAIRLMGGKARGETMPTDPYPVEAPQYPALARAVGQRWRLTLLEFRRLRARWFAICELTDPAPGPAARILPEPQRAALDGAIETFLTRFAGGDRSRFGFSGIVAAERILQDSEFIAYETGERRGRELIRFAKSEELTEAQKTALLEDAFDRMSETGRLRFETRLLEIRSRMLTGFEQGENPLAIARSLSRDLTGYEQGNLRRLIRTEMAFSSERAILDVGERGGVELWDVIGDPTTDAACVDVQNGGPYTTAQMRGLLPIHPNCFDSAVPRVE